MVEPTVEEPQVEEPKPEMTVQDEATALLDELANVGVESPEQISNMARASSESGRLANIVGELRSERDELKQMVQDLSSKPKEHDPYGGYDDNSTDIRSVIRDELKSARNAMTQEENVARQQAWAEYADIQNDEDFGLVKEPWEQHIQNPQTQYKINTGQTTAQKEYNRVVKGYYRNVAIRSKKILEQMGGTAGKVVTPHVEGGTPPAPAPEIRSDDVNEKLKNIKGNWKGDNSDVDALLDAFIPSGDPILRTDI